MFLQKSITRNLVLAAKTGLETSTYAHLWLMTYAFLLRMPSEALPVTRGDASLPLDMQSVIYLKDSNTVCLKLRSRKNRLRGSTLERVCCCAAFPEMCPVHVLWHGFFEHLEVGAQPWAVISASQARQHLRQTLQKLSVPNAMLYGTHDFRRGHAKDLQLSGASLAIILAAGEWRSRAIVSYIDMARLERDVALEAAMHSDDEDVDWID